MKSNFSAKASWNTTTKWDVFFSKRETSNSTKLVMLEKLGKKTTNLKTDDRKEGEQQDFAVLLICFEQFGVCQHNIKGSSTSGDFKAWICLVPVSILKVLRVSLWKSSWVLMLCLRLSASRFPNMPAGGFLAILCVLLYILVEIVPLWARNSGLSYGPSINKS